MHAAYIMTEPQLPVKGHAMLAFVGTVCGQLAYASGRWTRTFFYPRSAASASTVREAAVFLCLESNEFCGALYGQTNTCLVQTRAHTMNHLAIG